MYRTIMVPTDCSGFDREAIRVALRLAERSDAKVHLVRVMATGAFFGMGSPADGVGMTLETIRRERDSELGELYALAAECRATTTAEVAVSLEEGAVADSLAAFAERNAVDLIVISSHGRHGISRMSLGSVADSLIRKTAIPVLVVKPVASYLNPQVDKPFSRIVVPLDGSPLAEQVLPKVAVLAALEEAELTLLYVLKPHDDTLDLPADATAPWWNKEVASARAYLQRRADGLRRKGLAVTTDVVTGINVAEEITAFAGRVRADLIAIATHGRGGLSRITRGSVADAVTRSAWSSTLVFHPDKSLETAKAEEKSEASRFAPILAS